MSIAMGTQLIASNGQHMPRGSWGSDARLVERLEPMSLIAGKAADHALRRIGGRNVPSGKYPVIFEAPIATSLLGDLFAAIDGHSQYRGSSFLLNSMGTRIIPGNVDIYEQPLLKRGIRRALFNSEGVATRDQVWSQKASCRPICWMGSDFIELAQLDPTYAASATEVDGIPRRGTKGMIEQVSFEDF